MRIALSWRPTCTQPTTSPSCFRPSLTASHRSWTSFLRRARRHHHPLPRPPWQLNLSFGSLHRPRWCEIGLRAPVLRHTQRALSAIVTEAETQRAVSLIHALDKPSLPRHMELYHSNYGDTVTLAMAPSDPATTPPNEIFETGMKRRPLIERTPMTPSERRKCPVCHKESTCERSVQEPVRSVDEFGDRIVGCKGVLPVWTKLWHDPLV